MSWRYLNLALSFVLCLVACGEAGDADDTTPPDETSTSAAQEGELPSDLRAVIISEAAARAGVTEDQVEVVSVEAEIFDDSSLGCPQEGQAYTQVVTPGYVVIVEAGETELDYRVDQRIEAFFLCEEP